MIDTNGTHIISFIKTGLILNWDSAGNYTYFKNHIHEKAAWIRIRQI